MSMTPTGELSTSKQFQLDFIKLQLNRSFKFTFQNGSIPYKKLVLLKRLLDYFAFLLNNLNANIDLAKKSDRLIY